MSGARINQADFVDVVEQARLTRKESITLRLYLGVDGEPMPSRKIAKQAPVTASAARCHIGRAKKKIRERCAYVPFLLDRPKTKSVKSAFKQPRRSLPFMMTLSKAEKIVGGSIGVGEPDKLKNHRLGYVRVACVDAFGEVLSETGRSVAEALELLVRSNYSRSREFVMKRDNYRCTNCGAIKGVDADHVIPRARGARCDHPSNLTCLCPPCHEIRHKAKGFHA